MESIATFFFPAHSDPTEGIFKRVPQNSAACIEKPFIFSILDTFIAIIDELRGVCGGTWLSLLENGRSTAECSSVLGPCGQHGGPCAINDSQPFENIFFIYFFPVWYWRLNKEP